MTRLRSLSLLGTLTLVACSVGAPPIDTTPTTVTATATTQKPPETTPAAFDPANPFAKESTLPFHAPPFDKIKDTDYQPAFDEGMRLQLVEVDKIAEQKEGPTFENTIVAMERTGALLTRVSKVFFALSQANTNETLQKVEGEVAPKLAAHGDTIYLNAKLFARVKAIYDNRSSLDPESKFLVERYYRNFVRAGAQLSEDDKTKLRALNKEEATLETQFHDKLLAATNAGAIVVDDKAQLDGLSETDIAAAADLAKTRKMPGKWVIGLQNTTQHPAQVTLKNRSLREKLFKSSTQRTEHGDANDTRAIIQRMAELRAQRTKLLGFPDAASYILDDQMAKSAKNAEKLLTDMAPAAVKKAKGEAKKMQDLVDKEKGGFKLEPWDWQFYAEQVRKAEFALDEAQIKPYLELDRVLKDGIFFAAHELYGLTFKERKDIPIYQPDVRVFEVFDADGSSLALWYCDYFQRESKSGGAWEDSFVDQSALIGNKPVVYNVTNFTKPAPGQPALLSFDDVTAMFHEFGHALHAMFSKVKYPTFSGTSVPRDFAEFPSQFNEHWALDPVVFANYAKNYKTGEVMPKALVDKIKKSRTFNQGFATTEYIAAALLDMAWHELKAEVPKQDVDVFEAASLKRFGVDFSLVPPRYRTSYFAHIWQGGYAAGYYAYLWSEVLDDDAFQWFVEHKTKAGPLNAVSGKRFRDMILSRGGTADAAELYKAFRGRDPSVEPLLNERGLK